MTSHACANCGGRAVEVGENGSPSRCATCGGVAFVQVRQTLHANVVTGPRELRVIPHAACSPERASQLFNEIHAAIDSAE